MFALILLLTTLAVAGSAAGFSIYGLANIFEGAFLSVVFMGSALEAGKLVAASYLYRYWHEVKLWLKLYFMVAIFVLMIITSTGIFGYLSSAYQEDTLQLKELQVQIDLLKEEKEELTVRKDFIDADIASLPNNYITARQRLLGPKGYGPELTVIKARVPDITKELHVLQQKMVAKKVHTGPIAYIAEAFSVKIDDATKWIIILLIIVFDPLAVALTLATNAVFLDGKRRKELKKEREQGPVYNPPSASKDFYDIGTIPAIREDEVVNIPTVIINDPPPPTKGEFKVVVDEPYIESPVVEPEPTINTVEELEETLEEPKTQEKLTPEETEQDEVIEKKLDERNHIPVTHDAQSAKRKIAEENAEKLPSKNDDMTGRHRWVPDARNPNNSEWVKDPIKKPE